MQDRPYLLHLVTFSSSAELMFQAPVVRQALSLSLSRFEGIEAYGASWHKVTNIVTPSSLVFSRAEIIFLQMVPLAWNKDMKTPNLSGILLLSYNYTIKHKQTIVNLMLSRVQLHNIKNVPARPRSPQSLGRLSLRPIATGHLRARRSCKCVTHHPSQASPTAKHHLKI